jgi:cytochrome c biogenesis protein CcdA
MDVSKELQEVLQVLANQFGTTIAHVWKILVRQQVVESWTMAIVIVLLGITTFLFFKGYLKIKAQNVIYKNDDTMGAESMLAACVFFGILAVLTPCFAISSIVTGFVNPEYGAMMDILSKLGQ